MEKRSKNRFLPSFDVEFDRERDGRWIAEIQNLPGVLAYGETKQKAVRRVYAIALRTLADRIEQGRTAGIITRLFEHAVARR